MKKVRRLVSINLVLVLLLAVLPLQAFATTGLTLGQPQDVLGTETFTTDKEDFSYTPTSSGMYTFKISATWNNSGVAASCGSLTVYQGSTSVNGFSYIGDDYTTYYETVYLVAGTKYVVRPSGETTISETTSNLKKYTIQVTKETVPTLSDGVAKSFSASADTPIYFEFTSSLAGVYAITVDANEYAQYYIRSEDDTSWTYVGATSNTSDGMGEILLEKNTTYYIWVTNSASSKTSGTITVERIYSWNLSTLTSEQTSITVSPCVVYSSSGYTTYSYSAYVAFTPTVSGYYGLIAQEGTVEVINNYTLYVYSSDGSLLYSGYSVDKDGNGNKYGVFQRFEAGETYYIKIVGSSDVSSVTVSAVGVDQIKVKVACPVNASITLDGTTLSSEGLSIGSSATATFGTVERVSDGSTDGAILFSLDYNEDYELFIWGIGDGTMSLDISYYIDDILIETRSFENIGISTETKVTGNNFDYKDDTVIYVYDGTSTTELVVESPFADTEEDSGSTSSGSSTTHYYADASYKITVDSTKNGSVSVSDTRAYEGDTVTLTVTPDDGYELDSLTVTNVSTGKTVKVTQKSDTKYTFTMPDSKVTVEATFVKVEEAETEVLGTLIKQDPETPFTDISTSRFKSAIAEVYAAGLMNGVTETTFDPEGTLTRAMVVTTLYRLAGEPAVTGSSSFSDVADGQWYTEAVIWAAQNGVVEGYTDGTFQPDTAVTREQLATILYRYASRNGIYVGNTFALDGFTDCDAVHDYAVTAMEWAVANSVLVSRTTAMLDATEAATRAEVAQALSTLIS